jgi:hypothetical protein
LPPGSLRAEHEPANHSDPITIRLAYYPLFVVQKVSDYILNIVVFVVVMSYYFVSLFGTNVMRD